jgi:hypothetical protein
MEQCSVASLSYIEKVDNKSARKHAARRIRTMRGFARAKFGFARANADGTLSPCLADFVIAMTTACP